MMNYAYFSIPIMEKNAMWKFGRKDHTDDLDVQAAIKEVRAMNQVMQELLARMNLAIRRTRNLLREPNPPESKP